MIQLFAIQIYGTIKLLFCHSYLMRKFSTTNTSSKTGKLVKKPAKSSNIANKMTYIKYIVKLHSKINFLIL